MTHHRQWMDPGYIRGKEYYRDMRGHRTYLNLLGGEREDWLPVVGFEGFYEVSNMGRVRSLPRQIKMAYGARRLHHGKVMTPVLDRHGYPRVVLRIDGKHYTRAVHRLVAEAFLGEMKNVLHREVDHLDGDRSNARVSNLKWVSRGENLARRRMSPKPDSFSPLTAADVQEIRAQKGVRSGVKVAADYGVTCHAIYGIWNGKRWASLPPAGFGHTASIRAGGAR